MSVAEGESAAMGIGGFGFGWRKKERDLDRPTTGMEKRKGEELRGGYL